MEEEKHYYRFVENDNCEYYPCHEGMNDLNCLFCFCPLYFLECPGDSRTLPNGIKDCSACEYPHKRENYSSLVGLIAQAMKDKKRGNF